jgi:hypothetical protein
MNDIETTALSTSETKEEIMTSMGFETVRVTGHYTKIPDYREYHSNTNVAIKIVRSLPEDYIGNEMVNLCTEVGVSSVFYEMMDEVNSGELDLRDFAAYWFKAGRLSVALK